MRLFLAMCIAASAALGCTCFPPGVESDLDHASVVFRGVVKEVKELPSRPDLQRERYAVTFAVSQYWKGTPGREITLPIDRPGTDCIGAHFDANMSYLRSRRRRILTVNNYCDSTAPVKDSRKTLRALGRGKKPVE
jgi:hypothetical protein